jgi:PAS domain-containing protein
MTYGLDKVVAEHVPARVEEPDRIWNVLQDLLVITDVEGKYISVNPAWTTVLGWSEADLLGHIPELLIHPDDREKSWINRFAMGQRASRFENRALRIGSVTETEPTDGFPGWRCGIETEFMQLPVT